MTSRFIVFLACLMAAESLPAQEEGRDRSLQQPVRATDPVVLNAAGIDRSLIDAAQFRILSQLSEAGLRAALDGADPSAITALNGQTLDKVIFAAIGDVDEQLVYKPLTPCRVIDTRNTVGDFSAGETRHYDLIGPSNYSAYGGNVAGCGIPADYISTGLLTRANRVRALVVNLTSVTPTGTGYLIAWPTNQSAPNASLLNYGNDFALANGLTLRTCSASCDYFAIPGCNPCPSGDLSIRNASGTTHVLVDVLGYMEPAELPSGSEGLSAPIALNDPICRELASCVATNNSSATKAVTAIAHTNVTLNHTNGFTSTFMLTISGASAFCGDPSSANQFKSKFKVSQFHPSDPYMEGTATSSRRFEIAPHSSVTVYLNGRNVYGAGTGDFLDGGMIQCIVNQ